MVARRCVMRSFTNSSCAVASMQACLRHMASESALPRSAVVAGLTAAGVSVTEHGEPTVTLPAVLVFDDAERAAEILTSEAPARRVLAVASSSAGLRGEVPWRLLGAGASDVIAWDQSPTPARVIAARLERWLAIDAAVDSPLVRENLVGRSAPWLSLLRQVVELAAFTDSSVLLLGESGTGKEMLARLIHTLDRRKTKKELVVLDCTTVVPELSGSEFFGHERGAFTGADGGRDGAFALAHGGTLFLDEVGELPHGLQAQILRAVQERTFKRVGGNLWQQVDFRLVCATNRDLEAEVGAGTFRRDLFHRVASWVARLPPLEARRDDIPLLAAHFLREVIPAKAPAMDGAVAAFLLARPYPGNVRELRQLVHRIGRRHVGPGPISVGDIPPEERWLAARSGGWRDGAFEAAIREALASGAGLKEIGRSAAEVAVRLAIDEERGNLQRAARRLGVTDRALQLRRGARRSDAEGGR